MSTTALEAENGKGWEEEEGMGGGVCVWEGDVGSRRDEGRDIGGVGRKGEWKRRGGEI